MTKFNEKDVAMFLSSQHYSLFEYQAPGKVAQHFGVTVKTAQKWVNRVIYSGAVKRTGQVAVCLV